MTDRPDLYLAILLDVVPRCFWVEMESQAEVDLGRHRLRVDLADISIFSDWIFDDDGRVVGAEPHVFEDDMPRSLFDVLHDRQYISFDSAFPCIWLTKARSGNFGHLEAFETYYASDDAGRWAVLMPVCWLSEREAASLTRLAGPPS